MHGALGDEIYCVFQSERHEWCLASRKLSSTACLTRDINLAVVSWGCSRSQAISIFPHVSDIMLPHARQVAASLERWISGPIVIGTGSEYLHAQRDTPTSTHLHSSRIC